MNHSLELVVGFGLLYCFGHMELGDLSFFFGQELRTAALIVLELVEEQFGCVSD